MSEPPSSNVFVFNSLIDPDTIFDLYENDYQYIEEIFSTVLANIEEDVDKVRLALVSGEPEDLRRAVHKIKPTFGFLGMLMIEQECRQLEDKCRTSQHTNELAAQTEELLLLLKKAHIAIEEDYKRLIIYNKA